MHEYHLIGCGNMINLRLLSEDVSKGKSPKRLPVGHEVDLGLRITREA
jgi:hypothetical protein